MSEPSPDLVQAAYHLLDKYEQTTMGNMGGPLNDPNNVNHRFTVKELVRLLVEFASARVEAEREACARTCEAQRWFGARQNENLFDRTRDRMAEAIRSRGKVTR